MCAALVSKRFQNKLFLKVLLKSMKTTKTERFL